MYYCGHRVLHSIVYVHSFPVYAVYILCASYMCISSVHLPSLAKRVSVTTFIVAKNVREMSEIAMYICTSSRRTASSSCRSASSRFC